MTNEYIPTLGEYAAVIDWLVNRPSEELPQTMRKAYNDALERAEMRRFARSMEDMLDATEYTLGYRPPEWQMVWLNADWHRSDAWRTSIKEGRILHQQRDALSQRFAEAVDTAVRSDLAEREAACRTALELTDDDHRNSLHLMQHSDGYWSIACLLPGSGRQVAQNLLDEYEAEHGVISQDEIDGWLP